MNNEPMTLSKRESELALYLNKQPYLTKLDGIDLEIGKNVFPSNFGITSSFFGCFMQQQKLVNHALDMGCGSGYFALLLKKIGCKHVLGVDLNEDAVNCAKENVLRNPTLAPIDIIHSDLFVSVPQRHFDLIVFNFNYYPSNGDLGLYHDGGQEILKRFFSQVTRYIDEKTRIYIPYSLFVGKEHNPKIICASFGFVANRVARTINETGEHVIYEVMLTQDKSA